jgi:hypothetical protein
MMIIIIIIIIIITPIVLLGQQNINLRCLIVKFITSLVTEIYITMCQSN